MQSFREKLEAENNERLKDMEEEKLIAEQRLTESEAKTRQANQLLSETQAELDDIKAVQDRKVPNNKIFFLTIGYI